MPNIIEIKGEVAYIHLVNGKFAIIDSKDVDKVKEYEWKLRESRNRIVGKKSGEKRINLSKLIIGPRDYKYEVNYFNDNIFDCQIKNLNVKQITEGNRIEIVGDVAYIHMRNNKVAIIDSEDVDKVKEYNWHLVHNRKVRADRGSRNGVGSLGRLILGITDKKLVADHIDRNSLDCRKKNLRPATAQQNSFNCSLAKDSRSGYKGCHIMPKSGKIRVKITFNGKGINLGTFTDLATAAKVRDEKSKELFGEFACLNFKE
jgi:hypothetical protein